MNILYERLGGESAIDAAVQKFYQKVLADERIKHFFEGVNIGRLVQHQKKFMTFAFGGAQQYSGPTLQVSHKHLVEQMGLNDFHFDAVMENLTITLEELHVTQDLIKEVSTLVETTRPEILNRTPS